MKKIFIATIATVIFLTNFNSFSQEIFTGNEANQLISGAELIRTSKFSSIPSYVKYREGKQPILSEYVQSISKILKLDSKLSMVLDAKNEDRLGFVHYKYHQESNGIPIEYTTWYVHSKQGKVVSANGFVHNSLPVPSNPVISSTQSIANAINFVGANSYKWQLPLEEKHIKLEQNNPEATYYPQPELVFVTPENMYSSDLYQVAYKMNIYAHEPMSHQTVYVNAQNGQVIKAVSKIHHTDTQGTAVTGYSGTQTITTDSASSSNFRLRETGRGLGIETYNLLQGTSYGQSVDFTDTDNYWNNSNAQFDEYATDAHWGAEKTYDYYFSEHNQNSIDNFGFKLISYVHYSSGYYNAFWDGSRMTYGDGNGNPLTSIDVTGHEITHGLTEFTANLVYQGESGALNESFSDIFGTAVERYGRPLNWNWTLGDDFGNPFRSMSNPGQFGDPDTYFGNNWASLSGGDNGGVHSNSGVQNYWFYLLSEGGSGTNDLGNSYNVSGIGFDDAASVAFRNLTIYLNQTSDFSDAQFFSFVSAVDLFGACTPKVGEVIDAWYGVGIGKPYVPYVVSDFESSIHTSCVAPLTVNFTNLSSNGLSFFWDFGDGTTSSLREPSHTYTNLGSYNVTLTTTGGSCGTADTTKANYVQLSDTLPCIISMPQFGIAQNVTSCTGYLFDSGGADENYGANESSQITISPTGANSINFIVHSFNIEAGANGTCNYDDFKVYDGPNTSSPLIGTFCNNNPLTDFVSTTGSVTFVFTSDPGLEMSGFELEWICNSPNSAPIARFKSDVISICSGDVSFIDQSNNSPNSWLWNFGDGQTSTSQNPVHHYNASGTYTVSLTASNAFGSGFKSQINVIQINLKTPPVTIGDTACIGYSDTLIAISSGTHNWYNTPYSPNIIYTGDTLVTAPLSATETFYVEQVTNSTMDSVGPADNNFGTGGYFSGDQSLIFDVSDTIILESVYVYSDNSSNRVIELRDAAGTILESASIFISNGEQRINLGFTIIPGSGYQLGVTAGSSPSLYRNNTGPSYPYTINGLASITSSSAGSGFYYFFYDWYVSTPVCNSQRVPVMAVIDECTGINEPLSALEISIFPNPAENEITITAKVNGSKTNYLKIYNSIGQLMTSKWIESERTKVDVSSFASGIYYVTIYSDNQQFTDKILIK